MTQTLVVVGNGMVGHRLVEILRDSSWRIVVFGEESRPAYDRVALSSYVDSWTFADLELPALTAFLVFYGLCVGTTWWFYLRRNVFATRPSLAYAGV